MRIAIHLTEDEVRRFVRHQSSAGEVRRIARHLQSCRQCHVDSPSLDVVSGILESDEEHLRFDELAAIADGATAEGSRHAQRCVTCARELADLRQFRMSLPRRHRSWPWLAAAALLIALMLGGFAAVRIEARRNEMRLAEVRLPAQALAMQSRRLSFRGEMGRSPLDVIEPRNSMVMSDRPTFRWNAPAAAISVVEVFASDFTLVARSPALTSRTWTSPVALRQGVPYRWQVTVGTTTIPAPPLPEAMFVVVPEEQAKTVRELERSAQQPSLELASAYAAAGDFDRARAELRLLIRDGTQTRAAEKLLVRIDGRIP